MTDFHDEEQTRVNSIQSKVEFQQKMSIGALREKMNKQLIRPLQTVNVPFHGPNSGRKSESDVSTLAKQKVSQNHLCGSNYPRNQLMKVIETSWLIMCCTVTMNKTAIAVTGRVIAMSHPQVATTRTVITEVKIIMKD